MSKCIPFQIANGFGIMCLSETDVKCPRCGYLYTETDYYKQLNNSKRGFIYKKCKGCGVKLGITSDYKGDVHVWLKEEERKILT